VIIWGLTTSSDFLVQHQTQLWNGVILSAELGLLLFGALLFYQALQKNDHFTFIKTLTTKNASPLWVLMVLAFFLAGFFEGVAGFGIPAMLVTPMLLKVGLKAKTAIIAALVGGSVAVHFGALGTPIKIGLDILEPGNFVNVLLSVNILAVISTPFLLAALYSALEKKRVAWKKEWRMLLGAGVCFLIPYVLGAFWSIEIPSVLAGGVGLVLFCGFFGTKSEQINRGFWWRSFSPYVLFVALLMLGKFLLADMSLVLGDGIRNVSFFQPGFIFIITTACYVWYCGKNVQKNYNKIAGETLAKIKKPLITILLLVVLAHLIRVDLVSSFNYIYGVLPHSITDASVPLAGIFGAFLVGSATVSNLLFGALGNTTIETALIASGSTIGNIISLQNIVMVKSVVNAKESVGGLFLYGLKIVVIYLLLLWISLAVL